MVADDCKQKENTFDAPIKKKKYVTINIEGDAFTYRARGHSQYK